jgi:hypothetical protein
MLGCSEARDGHPVAPGASQGAVVRHGFYSSEDSGAARQCLKCQESLWASCAGDPSCCHSLCGWWHMTYMLDRCSQPSSATSRQRMHRAAFAVRSAIRLAGNSFRQHTANYTFVVWPFGNQWHMLLLVLQAVPHLRAQVPRCACQQWLQPGPRLSQAAHPRAPWSGPQAAFRQPAGTTSQIPHKTNFCSVACLLHTFYRHPF